METIANNSCTAEIFFTNPKQVIEFLKDSGPNIKGFIKNYLKQFPELKDKQISNIRILIPELLEQKTQQMTRALYRDPYNFRRRELLKQDEEKEIRNELLRIKNLNHEYGFCIGKSIRTPYKKDTWECTTEEKKQVCRAVSSSIEYGLILDKSSCVAFISKDPAALSSALKEKDKNHQIMVIDPSNMDRTMERSSHTAKPKSIPRAA